jgi:predicted Fe-Mo cluster-binding NifX family protein
MSRTRIARICLAASVVLVALTPAFFLSVKPRTSACTVAIPANQPSLASAVASQFARCPYLIICDISNDRVKYVPNRFAYRTHEVGLQVTHLLLREKVGAAIAVNIGPEPYEHLSARGVKLYNASGGTVLDAIQSFKARALVRMNGPGDMTRDLPRLPPLPQYP